MFIWFWQFCAQHICHDVYIVSSSTLYISALNPLLKDFILTVSTSCQIRILCMREMAFLLIIINFLSGCLETVMFTRYKVDITSALRGTSSPVTWTLWKRVNEFCLSYLVASKHVHYTLFKIKPSGLTLPVKSLE